MATVCLSVSLTFWQLHCISRHYYKWFLLLYTFKIVYSCGKRMSNNAMPSLKKFQQKKKKVIKDGESFSYRATLRLCSRFLKCEFVVSVELEPITAVIGQSFWYILDRLPVGLRINTNG